MPIPEKTEPVMRTTAKEHVYQTLLQWIIDRTLEDDERLNDTELAEYFSVSRTPVREALQLLHEQKFVYIIPSSGTYVAPIDKEDAAHVYTLLGGLQALALDMCISKITDEDYAYLEAVNEKFHKKCLNGDTSGAYKTDIAFHSYLCKITGNPYLIKYSEQLFLLARRTENRFFSEHIDLQGSYECHKSILENMRRGKLDEAKKEICENWTNSIP